MWYLITFLVGVWFGLYLGNEKFRRKLNAAMKPWLLKLQAYMKKKPSWKVEQDQVHKKVTEDKPDNTKHHVI